MQFHGCRTICANLDCLVILIFFILRAECAKQRSWLGPNFVSGTVPLARDGAGFASVDGMLYVFGGTGGGTGGELLSKSLSLCMAALYGGYPRALPSRISDAVFEILWLIE